MKSTSHSGKEKLPHFIEKLVKLAAQMVVPQAAAAEHVRFEHVKQSSASEQQKQADTSHSGAKLLKLQKLVENADGNVEVTIKLFDQAAGKLLLEQSALPESVKISSKGALIQLSGNAEQVKAAMAAIQFLPSAKSGTAIMDLKLITEAGENLIFKLALQPHESGQSYEPQIISSNLHMLESVQKILDTESSEKTPATLSVQTGELIIGQNQSAESTQSYFSEVREARAQSQDIIMDMPRPAPALSPPPSSPAVPPAAAPVLPAAPVTPPATPVLFSGGGITNTAPVIVDAAFPATEDTLATFAMGNFSGYYTDANGDGLTKIKILSLPLNGALELSGAAVSIGQEMYQADLANITYNPNAGYNGADSFQWQASDGVAYSNIANFNITVASVNDAPTDITLSNATVVENSINGTVIGNLGVVDPDGPGVSYTLTNSAGGRFAVVNNAGTWEVRVADSTQLDYEASTSHNIDVQVSDGTLTFTKTFTITVTDIPENLSFTLTGGNDNFTGGPSADVFYSAEANFANADTLAGGTGADVLLFTDAATLTTAEVANKTGIDIIQFSANGNSVTLNNTLVDASDDGINLILDNSTYTITSLNTSAVAATNNIIIGGTGAVTMANANNRILSKNGVNASITGGSGIDTMEGGTGNDFFDGNSGNDTLSGGGGNDTLDGSAGRDTLTGGTGNDVFRFSNVSHSTIAARDTITDFNVAQDFINLHNMFYDGFGSSAGKLSMSFDGTYTIISDAFGFNTFSFRITGDVTGTLTNANLIYTASFNGTSGNDAINVTGAGSVAFGGDGNDTITGAANLQTYNGGGGDDYIIAWTGAPSDDMLTGGDGNDTLDGYGGADSLIGGAGADVFRINKVGSSNAGSGIDIIYDFTVGVDKINLYNLYFDGLGAGAGRLSMSFDGIYTNLTDSLGVTNFAIRLLGDYTATLTDADFTFSGTFTGTAAGEAINVTGTGTGVYGGMETIPLPAPPIYKYFTAAAAMTPSPHGPVQLRMIRFTVAPAMTRWMVTAVLTR